MSAMTCPVRLALACMVAARGTPGAGMSVPAPIPDPPPTAAAEANETTADLPPGRAAGAGRTGLAIGFGAGFPEGFPVDATWRPDARWSLRAFVTWPTVIRKTEPQAAERDEFFDSMVFATPPTEVEANIVYGPNLGLDYAHHPWGDGLGIGGGLMYYAATATADKSSIMFFCTSTARKCDATDADYHSESEIVHVRARAGVSGYKARAFVGWTSAPGSRWYFSALAGAAITVWSKRSSDVESSLDDTPELSPLVKDQATYVLDRKEQKMESKVDAAISRYDRRVLPLVLLSTGIRLN